MQKKLALELRERRLREERGQAKPLARGGEDEQAALRKALAQLAQGGGGSGRNVYQLIHRHRW
nr:MAG TPA: hypothetical protein [Caudoviricetes sp.]